MNLTMSMFANAEEYWKARSYLYESIVADVAKDLRCERDNEAILIAIQGLRDDTALGRAVRRDDFWELRKVRRVVRFGAIDPLSGVMPVLEWADEYMAARRDGAGKVEWESGPTPKAALMAAGLMEGEEK